MATSAFDMEKLYPAPWPEDVKTIHLETVSLSKLLDDDALECQRVFEACTSEGFFYLEMLDHPKGRKMWEDACGACAASQDFFPNRSLEVKRQFKPRESVGVFDTGYNCPVVAENGTPKLNEYVNIPQTELFSTKPSDFKLPDYLAVHEESFKATISSGNLIANIVLRVLERELKLRIGSFTSMHRLTDPSADFLRILRYPGTKPETIDHLTFPAHKDGLSVAILFTWLGGLQIPKPGAKITGYNIVAEEDWRWVKPVPGTAIVNLGEAMEIFTNQVLKAGLHRVVKAPGSQAPFDKYSVLIGTRPSNTALMRPFKSPLIPECVPEAFSFPKVMNSKEWGAYKIMQLTNFMKKREEVGEILKNPA